MEETLGKKAVRAAKWSLVTQLVSKLISPITTLVLAHLLTPDVFGVVALVTMVTSFADLFSDAGFQKYLIQHEYNDRSKFSLSANVAFWTNLAISMFLWAIIAVFRDQLALLLGNPEIGIAVAIACASLPLTSLISVQTAVYQREFDFKTLFYSRVGSSLLILAVAVPLALIDCGYWSMIVATIASNLLLAAWLTLRSKWRPSIQYSFRELGEMLSFSSWTLIEAISIWITNWAGAFILGSYLNEYYLGLYNTSVSLVNAVVGIVAGTVNPVAFASLSRLQSDRSKFDNLFYKMQKYLGFVLIPMSFALFVFADAIVGLYLGEAWLETATFLGFYSLSGSFVVVFSYISSDAYRALGKPRWSLLGQVMFLFFLIPSLVIGATSSYETLSIVVPAFRLVGSVFTNFIICKFLMRLSPFKMLANLKWVYLATLLISLPIYLVIKCFGIGYVGQIILFFTYILGYGLISLFITDLRSTLFDIADRFGIKKWIDNVIPLFSRSQY